MSLIVKNGVVEQSKHINLSGGFNVSLRIVLIIEVTAKVAKAALEVADKVICVCVAAGEYC